jgi:hypothetical protein
VNGKAGDHTMDKSVLRSVAPYFVGLAVAAFLYYSAQGIEYTQRAHELGPQTWPELAILLLGASCLFEIIRRVIVGNRDATGFIEAFERDEEEEKTPVYPSLLIAGIVLMAIYAVVVPYVGFIFGTFLFLAAFMYVGGFRAHATIWLTSFFVTFLCGVLFLRIAYVSLPRGIEPFSMATDIFFKIPLPW